MRFSKFAIFAVFLTFLPVAMPFMLSGNIYGPDLSYSSAVLRVNSTPPEQKVFNGSYSLELPAGTYEIYAYLPSEGLVFDDNITLSGDMSYDIILLPELGMEEPPAMDVDVDSSHKSWPYIITGVAALAILALAVIGLRMMASRKPDIDEHAIKALEIMEKEKRMNQKELRKLLGLSESKVSMLVSELEAIGAVKKIRKGRANIIVFRKKP